jgi:hypothetical protein
MSKIQNRGGAFRGLGALLDTLLANMEKLVAGNISLEQFLQSQANIPNIFQNPTLVSSPEWLQQNLADRILESIAAGGADSGRRAEELSVWIKKSNPAPVGAPWKPENYLLGLRAQHTYDSLRRKSWMKVAYQVCPEKGARHTCTQSCADRLRQAAIQSKKFAV